MIKNKLVFVAKLKVEIEQAANAACVCIILIHFLTAEHYLCNTQYQPRFLAC